MDREQIEITAFAAQLGAEELWCRMLVERSGCESLLISLIADSLIPRHDAAGEVYDYARVAFVSGKTLASELGAWLTDGKGKLGGVGFTVPKLGPQVERTRLPSYFHSESLYGLVVPNTRYMIRSAVQGQNLDLGPLVHSGCPSFPSVEAASYLFLYAREHKPGQGLPKGEIVIRVAHAGAWIERLAFNANSCTVTVRGDALADVRLEVRGEPNVYIDTVLQGEGDRSFPLHQGLPKRLWVILSRGSEWLDYRDTDLSGRPSSGVDGVVLEPATLAEQVAGLASGGESETVEYKEELPPKDDRFLKTIAAFANGEGGVLLVGVSDDPVSIKGIAGDISLEKERINNKIRDKVCPAPRTRIESCDVEGKQIIAIFVDRGETPPYGINPKDPRYYIRRSGSTYPATPDEVRALARFDVAADGGRDFY